VGPAPHSSVRRAGGAGRLVVRLLAALFGAVAGTGIGLVVGATYGGNYATELDFAGLRGYEATGLIGEIIGFFAGGAFGLLMACLLTRR
jgi:hypothetical protein